MSISINNEISKLNNLSNLNEEKDYKKYEQSNEQSNEQLNEQLNEQFNEHSNEQSNEQKDKLYVIHNFNPSIYFLNEDIHFAKLHDKKLLITNIGKYSITKPLQGKWIKSILIEFFKVKKLNTKFLSIIDANAGIGGDTIYFSKYFKNVYSIEKNNIHFDVLTNNIKALNLKNVDLYEGNFMNIINNKDNNLLNNKNILYMDPPWGGPEYKKQKYIDLDIELDEPNEKKLNMVINELYPHFNVIFLKAPINIIIDKSTFLYKNIFFKDYTEKKILLIIFSKI